MSLHWIEYSKFHNRLNWLIWEIEEFQISLEWIIGVFWSPEKILSELFEKLKSLELV